MTCAEILRKNRIWFAGLLALFICLYYSIVPDMARQWYEDDNYSHGFIIPLIAGYFLYERREALKKAPVEPWAPGILVIILGLLQLTVSRLGAEFFLMRSSMIVVLAGTVLYIFGRGVMRTASLPIFYLLFMVPLPYIIYDMIAFPLKLFVSRVSVGFLNGIGVVALREGNLIMFPTTTLEVADACSGIRSLVSLLALAAAYAFFCRRSAMKRTIIILSAIPVAVFTNSLRVIVTGILAQYWGARAAEGFFHEFAGLAVFALAMVILVIIGALVREKVAK